MLYVCYASAEIAGSEGRTGHHSLYNDDSMEMT
jgi:hypothetical protein